MFVCCSTLHQKITATAVSITLTATTTIYTCLCYYGATVLRDYYNQLKQSKVQAQSETSVKRLT